MSRQCNIFVCAVLVTVPALAWDGYPWTNGNWYTIGQTHPISQLCSGVVERAHALGATNVFEDGSFATNFVQASYFVDIFVQGVTLPTNSGFWFNESWLDTADYPDGDFSTWFAANTNEDPFFPAFAQSNLIEDGRGVYIPTDRPYASDYWMNYSKRFTNVSLFSTRYGTNGWKKRKLDFAPFWNFAVTGYCQPVLKFSSTGTQTRTVTVLGTMWDFAAQTSSYAGLVEEEVEIEANTTQELENLFCHVYDIDADGAETGDNYVVSYPWISDYYQSLGPASYYEYSQTNGDITNAFGPVTYKRLYSARLKEFADLLTKQEAVSHFVGNPISYTGFSWSGTSSNSFGEAYTNAIGNVTTNLGGRSEPYTYIRMGIEKTVEWGDEAETNKVTNLTYSCSASARITYYYISGWTETNALHDVYWYGRLTNSAYVDEFNDQGAFGLLTERNVRMALIASETDSNATTNFLVLGLAEMPSYSVNPPDADRVLTNEASDSTYYVVGSELSSYFHLRANTFWYWNWK